MSIARLFKRTPPDSYDYDHLATTESGTFSNKLLKVNQAKSVTTELHERWLRGEATRESYLGALQSEKDLRRELLGTHPSFH